MSDAKCYPLLAFCLVIGLTLHIVVKSETVHHHSRNHLTTDAPASVWFQLAVAGSARGLAADLNLMAFFLTFFDVTENQPNDELAERSWRHLYERLSRAQFFDPWFWDIYRLATGILGFRPEYTRRIIEMSDYGGRMRYWDWEPSFFGGMLAHNLLGDDRLAAAVMNVAVYREKAPPLMTGLSARFLASSSGDEDQLRFLMMMRKLLPDTYHSYIDQRIKRLKK